MSNRDGGPAYPKVISDPSVWHFDGGMTMRQYYKVAALSIIKREYSPCNSHIAKLAGALADEMIAEDEAHEREVGNA